MREPETVAVFMQRALFDPEYGYYTRRTRTVGARGDFSTAATLSPTLGRAIARWLRAEALRAPHVRDVIEIGGGDGSLLATIRDALGPVLRRWLRLHVVDVSEPLRRVQRERLGDEVTWHDDVGAALDAVGGRAFLFSNELLDALPVDVVQWTPEGWRLVGVLDAGRTTVREVLLPLELPPEEADAYSALTTFTPERPPPARSQRCELGRGAFAWLHGWVPRWRAGAMLTIDYGGSLAELVDRRPAGTLRAYFAHQRFDGLDVYGGPGTQDLTADVNFDDVRRWCGELGLREAWYGTQAAFVARWLPRLRPTPQDRFLLDPAGAGGGFKVLAHRR